MNIGAKLVSAICKQATRELYSSNLYLSQSFWAEQRALAGFSRWFRVQAEEERMHGLKFYDHIHERGGKAEVDAIELPPPPKTWNHPLDLFEYTLEHERFVSKNINELYNLAVEEKDHATTNFMTWYINEQIEEEKSVGSIVEALKRIKGNESLLYQIDAELGKRQLTPLVPLLPSAGMIAGLAVGGAKKAGAP